MVMMVMVIISNASYPSEVAHGTRRVDRFFHNKNDRKFKFNVNKKHSENADTSTSVTFDLELQP